MELIGLNNAFEPVKSLRCTNIQWNRKYYEAGDYAIQMRAADWDMTIAYIYTSERPETGMVEKIETESNKKGDFVNVSGFFLEGMLNWEPIFPYQFVTSPGVIITDSWVAGISHICKTMVSTLVPTATIIVPEEADIGGNVRVRKETCLGRNLGDTLYEILKKKEMGQRVTLPLDGGAEVPEYHVWKGLDRTQEQSTNSFATFGVKIGTVDAIKYTKDISDYKNYIIATYNNGTIDQYIALNLMEISDVEINARRALYYESGLTLADGQTLTELIADVTEAASLELARHNRLVTIDATPVQSNLKYLTDYDLGDKVDLVDDALKTSYSARISEASEVWKNNTHTVSIEYGEKQLTAYNRKRRY